ncbi:proteasome PCI domain-containing protein, putative [Eimeria necatrix]|uniref:Eukaryotic translation initiation factor 3 subunit E n=1 Tax=Eimeria necatrix TaxID=51315 RepID=U6MLV3_9EIME|nr:proteasome PCI domain-containing protein, putative [Eimeria necatrix]CDJ64028.1 proteasome PCI domain-containing protein, putative [Eimeria necatrix]
MGPAEENLALVRRMSLFWEPHMAVPVIQWLRSQQLLEESSCDALLESILPKTPEGIARRLRELVQQQGGAAEEPEQQLQEWEQQGAALEEVLQAFKGEQQRKIGNQLERKRLRDILQWHYQNREEGSETPNLAEVPRVEMVPVRLARVAFSLGDYKKALHHLDFYLNTLSELTSDSGDMQTPVSCVWGICCCILLLTLSDTAGDFPKGQPSNAESEEALLQQLQDGEDGKEKALGAVEAHGAARCILRLGDILDQSQLAASKAAAGIGPETPMSKIFSREQQLQQRAWLLHWAMWLLLRYYLLLTYAKGQSCRNQAWSALLDWVVQERNLTCVHLLCPHLLRYYAVYAIMNRKRKDHFQAIVGAIGHTKNKYTDAFTSLLEALFLDFNFDEAQKHITSISELCETDFFLEPLKGAVNEHARLLIFETYCRIHKRINVEMIAKKVNMVPEAAERWIVNLILHARLEARIDSEKNRVQMAGAPPSLYQLVTDKTRNLGMRTSLLIQNLGRPGYNRDEEANAARGSGRGRGRGRGWVRGGEQGRDGFYRGQKTSSVVTSGFNFRGGRGAFRGASQGGLETRKISPLTGSAFMPYVFRLLLFVFRIKYLNLFAGGSLGDDHPENSSFSNGSRRSRSS